MDIIKDYKPMVYPKEFKPVDGISCPKIYSSYDQTNYDCIYCGQAKLYKSCNYFQDRGACAGWEDQKYGPVSCKGYIQAIEDRSNFL
jgi:hypothetical protein